MSDHLADLNSRLTEQSDQITALKSAKHEKVGLAGFLGIVLHLLFTNMVKKLRRGGGDVADGWCTDGR